MTRDYYGKLQKMDHIVNPEVPADKTQVFRGQFVEGVFSTFPEPGKRFYIYSTSKMNEGIHTSQVKSVYVIDYKSGYDKLVIPSDFPKAVELDLDVLLKGLKQGDTVFATCNAIYLLSNVTETKRALRHDKEISNGIKDT